MAGRSSSKIMKYKLNISIYITLASYVDTKKIISLVIPTLLKKGEKCMCVTVLK
jgi:hypothetical protein